MIRRSTLAAVQGVPRLPKSPPALARALRHRNFRLFWFGQFISLIGTWMQALALQWLVYTLTSSAMAMGTVAALTSLPVLLLSPFAGVLVDRYNKHRVVIMTQTAAMVAALVLAALTFANLVAYWQILLLALGNGVINAIDMPARQAFLSEMVPDREDLLNAIALNSSVFNGARVIGPAVAGLLVGLVGMSWAFVLNGVSFIAVIAGLLLMRDLPAPHRNATQSSPLRSFAEGCRYALTTPIISTVLLITLVGSVLGFAYITLMPIFADQILTTPLISDGATRLGFLMMASGAGALAGALRVAALPATSDRRKILLQGTLGLGLMICVLAFNRSFWLALPIMAAVGFCMIMFAANANAVLQVASPDHLRGRVMGFYVTVFVGLGLVGNLLAGWIAEHWGAPIAVLLGGLGMLGVALVTGRMRSMRDEPASEPLASPA